MLPGAEPSASIGDLNVTEELLIEGEVLDGLPRTRIVQTVADRVFRAELPPGQRLTLRHLDIRGGDTANLGGAAWISSGANLFVDRCVLRDNHAASGGALAGSVGTGINVFGSDLSENTASSFGAAVHAAGSGLVNASSLRGNIAQHADASQRSAIHAPTGSSLTVANSTLSRNSGGIWTRADDTSLQSNTIVFNDQYGIRVIDNAGSSTFQMSSTILADNGAADCSIINNPQADMNRYNLIADGSCPGGATNLTQDPVLAPEAMRPANRLTWVHWPLNGSPVFDAVPDELFLCFDEDQLGNVRPTDTIAPLSPPSPACEIGALEVFAAQADPMAFQVNVTANDQVDLVPGDTQCDVSTANGEQCTLRAAVMEANALSGFNSIALGQPDMMVTLTRPAQPGPDSAADGDLDITDALSIVGIGTPATRPTIGFGFIDRIFDIAAAGDTVSIDRLRLSGGFNTNSGGAIRVLNAQDVQLSRLELSGNVSDAGGGALAVLGGSATLTDSDLHNNQTAGLGAAIRNNANLTIRSSSIRDNDDQSVPIEREAIAAEAGSVTEVINSTLARNSGTALAAVDGDVVVRSSTIVDHDRFGVSPDRCRAGPDADCQFGVPCQHPGGLPGRIGCGVE
ncbi:MAG: right-handed parallel beta-helix repeat-containing protein [Ahniella sp.]|nr:right-handed parallel beta-helix repeat-containing protein [Ahniella sp.]